ncbi:hypothetical protein WR25_02399 [Diploscapter pachys]|uniref:VWFA domain-containing protein n=1 Tax=Diploscapter pachys TaxID=2018661 RepID=A0A2A2LLV4_9BILA|nr:hypothetical protein WR25_02399 [Diploscapter pachys]
MNFKLLLLAVFISAHYSDAFILKSDHKGLMTAPKNRFDKKENLFTVNFIDGSGEYANAITDALTKIRNIYFNNFGDYAERRHVLAVAGDQFYPYPAIVNTSSDALLAQNYFTQNISYKGIFDLHRSVNEFLNDKTYSHHDNTESPFAIIWQYSDTINGFNNLLNAAEKLKNKGFVPLIITNRLTQYRLEKYSLKVLPENIYSLYNTRTILIQYWFDARIMNGDYVAPLINQTGMSGVIQSPGFPNFYPKYAWQDYYIETPSSEYQIYFGPKVFNLTYGGAYLYFFNSGPLDDDNGYFDAWTGSATSYLQPRVIPKSAILLRFVSYYVNPSQGFNISWGAISAPPKAQLELNEH